MKIKILLGVMLISMLLLTGCNTEPTLKEVLKQGNTNENNDRFKIPELTIDYSNEAYIKIKPNENTKFIFFECINSTLKINETSIYCENTNLFTDGVQR
jgi:hypothetical protein